VASQQPRSNPRPKTVLLRLLLLLLQLLLLLLRAPHIRHRGDHVDDTFDSHTRDPTGDAVRGCIHGHADCGALTFGLSMNGGGGVHTHSMSTPLVGRQRTRCSGCSSRVDACGGACGGA